MLKKFSIFVFMAILSAAATLYACYGSVSATGNLAAGSSTPVLPTAGFSTAGFSTAGFSTAGFSTAELPAAELPAVGLSTVGSPVAGLSTVELPVAVLPPTELPVAGLSTVELPVAELPVAELPAAELPMTALPMAAFPTASTVIVNGDIVEFDAYNINDNNYFKLRDLAYILSGATKQFDVAWDGENNAISLISGTPYTVVGGEMSGKGTEEKTPTPTSSAIFLDDLEITVTAFNIEDNNYFKLRDIGEAFDFGVIWDGDNNAVIVDTNIGYSAPDGNNIVYAVEKPTSSDSGAVMIEYADVSTVYTFAAIGEPEKYAEGEVKIEVLSSTEALFAISSLHPFIEKKFTFDIIFNSTSASDSDSFNVFVAYDSETLFVPMVWQFDYMRNTVVEPDHGVAADVNAVFTELSIDKAKGIVEWRLILPPDFEEFNFDMVGVKSWSGNYMSNKTKYDLDDITVKITGYDDDDDD